LPTRTAGMTPRRMRSYTVEAGICSSAATSGTVSTSRRGLAGRLVRVRDSGASLIVTYTYDARDRLRVADYGGSNRIRFRYVGLTTVVDQVVTDSSGAVQRNLGIGSSGERLVDWSSAGGSSRYYGTDAHHDTTWIAASDGSVVATLRYAPWGDLTAYTGSSLPDWRWQGSWFDTSTELSWAVTRWYAPTTGTFISEDGIFGKPNEPASGQLYAYARGNPIDSWDPDGRDSYRTFPIQNRAKFNGKLILSLFIQAQYNEAGPWRLYGDNRGFDYSYTPPCSRSRVCVTVDFPSKSVQVRVHDSCGDNWGPFGWWGYGCSPQFPIVTAVPMVWRCDIYAGSDASDGSTRVNARPGVGRQCARRAVRAGCG
jgi:RHS repeat-associated protein